MLVVVCIVCGPKIKKKKNQFDHVLTSEEQPLL